MNYYKYFKNNYSLYIESFDKVIHKYTLRWYWIQ